MSVSDKGDMQNVQSNGSRGTRLKITGLLDSVHPGKDAGNIKFYYRHVFGRNYINLPSCSMLFIIVLFIFNKDDLLNMKP